MPSARRKQEYCVYSLRSGYNNKGNGRHHVPALSQQSLCVPIPEALKDNIRAKTLRNMLLQIAQQGDEEAL